MHTEQSAAEPGRANGRVAAQDLTLLALCWIALVALADPRGNFAMLDDWSYGRSVKHLLEQGVLRYDGWNAPTLFLQVLYGAAWCLPLGFSFEALRASALFAGLAGGVGTYVLLREALATRLVALSSAFALMLGPSYFQHAFTFMTDVPFTALSVWASVFYLRALCAPSLRSVVAGTVLAACAALVRQPGVLIPVAYGVALLTLHGWRRNTLARALCPTAAVAAVYGSYAIAINLLEMEPVLLGSFAGGMRANFVDNGLIDAAFQPLKRALVCVDGLALMLLPMLVPLALRRWQAPWRSARAARNLLAAALLTVLLALGVGLDGLPYEIFQPIPLVMTGQADWGAADEHHRFRPMIDSVQLTAVALLAFVVATMLLRGQEQLEAATAAGRRATLVFGMCGAALMLAPFLFSHLYERYLLPAAPYLMVALAATSQSAEVPLPASPVGPASRVVAGMLLVGFATISVLFAHDSMLWNRLRWQAVEHLVSGQRIEPRRIDGGLAVSGWYLFPEEGPLRRRFASSPSGSRQWWRNDEADHIVAITTPRRLQRLIEGASPGPDEPLDVVWSRTFAGWLPNSDGQVLVCRGRLCLEAFKKPASVPATPN